MLGTALALMLDRIPHMSQGLLLKLLEVRTSEQGGSLRRS